MNQVKKIFIYVFLMSGCAFLGLGMGWLVDSIGAAIAFVIGGQLLVDMTSYLALIIPLVISSASLIWGYRLAGKILSSTLTKKDKIKFFAFVVCSLVGFSILLFKIVKDSYPSSLDKVNRYF